MGPIKRDSKPVEKRGWEEVRNEKINEMAREDAEKSLNLLRRVLRDQGRKAIIAHLKGHPELAETIVDGYEDLSRAIYLGNWAKRDEFKEVQKLADTYFIPLSPITLCEFAEKALRDLPADPEPTPEPEPPQTYVSF